MLEKKRDYDEYTYYSDKVDNTNNLILNDIGNNNIVLVKSNDLDKKERLLITSLSLITMTICLIAYLILLSFKLQNMDMNKFYWLYTNIPIALFLICLTISFIVYADLDNQNIVSTGKILIISSIILLNGNIFAFWMLTTLHLDNLLGITIQIIFVPLFILLAVCGIGIIYIAPGFLDENHRDFKTISLVTIYFLSFLAFTIILYFKLTSLIKWNYTSLLSILLSALIIHLIFLLVEIREKTLLKFINEGIFLFTMILGLIFISMNLNQANIPWFIVFMPFYIGCIYMLGLFMKYMIEGLSIEGTL